MRDPSIALSIISDLDLDDECQPLLVKFQKYLDIAGELTDRVSLLVLDVFVKMPNGQLLPVSAHTGMEVTIAKLFSGIYRRSGHAASMKENRYAFLLRHREEPQAYLLVRKIMQLCLFCRLKRVHLPYLLEKTIMEMREVLKMKITTRRVPMGVAV